MSKNVASSCFISDYPLENVLVNYIAAFILDRFDILFVYLFNIFNILISIFFHLIVSFVFILISKLLIAFIKLMKMVSFSLFTSFVRSFLLHLYLLINYCQFNKNYFLLIKISRT